MTATVTTQEIEQWAARFVGRIMNLPYGQGTIEVASYKLGGRGKGAWFLGNKIDGSGHGETYRKFPKKARYV